MQSLPSEISIEYFKEKIYQKYENINKCNVRGHPWDNKQNGIKNSYGFVF